MDFAIKNLNIVFKILGDAALPLLNNFIWICVNGTELL